MKKILYIVMAAALIAVGVSCSKEEAAPAPKAPASGKVSMTVSAGFGAATRTYLDGLKVKWSENDQIGIIDSLIESSASNAIKAKAIQTFSIKSRSADNTQAVFEGEIAPGLDVYYATYPFSAQNFVNVADSTIRIPFTSAQKASAPGTFDAGYNPSIALLKDGVLSFKNLGGLLKFELEDANVRSATLTAKDGGTIGGVYYVKMDKDGNIASATLASARNSMTLSPAAGDTFAPGVYYFCLTARNYVGGISLSFALTDGPNKAVEITKDVPVERSKITNIGSISTKQASVDPVNFPVVFPMGFAVANPSDRNDGYCYPTNAEHTWLTDWANDAACASATRTTEKWTGRHGILYSATQPQAYMSWNWTEAIKDVCTEQGVKYFIETSTSTTWALKLSVVGVKGVWTGDFFEFVIPVKDFAAETTLSLTMPIYTRGGPTFWEVKYLDGETWKTTAVANLPAFAGSDVTRTATWAIPFGGAANNDNTLNTNQTVNMTFSNAVASGEIKIRVVCVDGSVQSDAAEHVNVDQTNPLKASNGNASAPFYFWNPGDRDHQAITIDVVTI